MNEKRKTQNAAFNARKRARAEALVSETGPALAGMLDAIAAAGFKHTGPPSVFDGGRSFSVVGACPCGLGYSMFIARGESTKLGYHAARLKYWMLAQEHIAQDRAEGRWTDANPT